MTITALRLRTPPRPRREPDVAVHGRGNGAAREVLTGRALEFLAGLHRAFEPRRRELLARRAERQRAWDAGKLPDFLADTRDVRGTDWAVAPAPPDLVDRRVEITGPTDRKMMINALNSGANVFMADFEDATSPTWHNVLTGQVNLRDRVRGTLRYLSPDGRRYELHGRAATLMVRPRGLHLPERHLTVDGAPMAGALCDFGLFFFHNARALVDQGSGPYFYLPKLESHHEARLWNDIFVYAQDALGLPRGTVRATVLIETVPAAFEMDEILYELRDHSAGLNCGRWDYIFSFIKTFRSRPDRILPDRALITMDRPFLRAYGDLLVQTCHRRGAHALGGMAAHIPVKDDPAANEAALEHVRADKRREARAGHDGTWVAHPGLVPVAREAFDAALAGPHQLHVARDDVRVGAAELLAVPDGPATIEGLRRNLDVALQYVEAWLHGVGCVPIYNLMEDAATAEICRAQVWQWLRHGARLADGRPVTAGVVRDAMARVLARTEERLGAAAFRESRFFSATLLLDGAVTADECPEFLTTLAYDWLD